MKNTNGFTLLELLVVMVIISVLSLGIAHGWQRWQQQQRLDDSARQIQLFLLRLRSEANWHNEPRLLWLIPGKAWCLGSGAPRQRCQGRHRQTLRAPWKEVRLLSLTEGLGFYGRRNVARPGRVVIAGEAGERHIVVSSRGRVRICHPTGVTCS